MEIKQCNPNCGAYCGKYYDLIAYADGTEWGCTDKIPAGGRCAHV